MKYLLSTALKFTLFAITYRLVKGWGEEVGMREGTGLAGSLALPTNLPYQNPVIIFLYLVYIYCILYLSYLTVTSSSPICAKLEFCIRIYIFASPPDEKLPRTCSLHFGGPEDFCHLHSPDLHKSYYVFIQKHCFWQF
jgi:hypothetical protein